MSYTGSRKKASLTTPSSVVRGIKCKKTRKIGQDQVFTNFKCQTKEFMFNPEDKRDTPEFVLWSDRVRAVPNPTHFATLADGLE